jgi:hypothetical protein
VSIGAEGPERSACREVRFVCSWREAPRAAIEPSCGHEIIADILDGFSGILMVDDYVAYQTAKKLLPKMTIVLCWAHARRAYVEALDAYPECQHAIDLIAKLFEIERDLSDWRVGQRSAWFAW